MIIMESFLFALNSVMPIILTVAVGYFLKKAGLMTPEFTKMANKLVFRVFLPVMLFLNVYSIESIADISFGFVLYAATAVLIIFALATAAVVLVTDKSERRGALLQGSFRSNYALIGIPLATSLFGAEGAQIATVLSAILVPVFNILAVISLSIYSKKDGGGKLKRVLLGIAKNPLIIGICIGLLTLGIRALFVRIGFSFRLSSVGAVFGALKYLSNLATPLALLCLGAQFEFSAITEMKKEIIFGTLVRCVVVPALGIGGAYLLFKDVFSGAHFAAFVAAFGTPVAVSSVPMAQEMGADHSLAGQLVVWTTILSAFTVFITSFILKSIGVF